jgi:hypothetical protein
MANLSLFTYGYIIRFNPVYLLTTDYQVPIANYPITGGRLLVDTRVIMSI